MMATCLFFSLFVLLVTPSDSSDVVSHGPVQVTAGDDVILPCHLDPPSDVSKLMVVWEQTGLLVHLYRDGADYYKDQDQQFRGRTSLFHSEMTRGNISLKLTNVHQEDSGLYSCYIPRLESQVKRGHVNLIVYPQNEAGGQGGERLDVIIIIMSVWGALSIIAVSALMFLHIRGRRRTTRRTTKSEQGINWIQPMTVC